MQGLQALHEGEPKWHIKFNRHSRPISIHSIPQQIVIKSLEVSDSGQNGVIFIELEAGSFVLKPTCHTPSDLFFNHFARRLGISVPEMNHFSHYDQICHRLYSAIQSFCRVRKEQCLLARLKSRLNGYFGEIFEYIPSVSLAHIGESRFQRFFSDQPKNLHSIGQCIGFDMLVNNHDRFRLIWGGDGNISNFLISVPNFHQHELKDIIDRSNESVELRDIQFIDNEGNMCDVDKPVIAKNMARYFEKVTAFHEKMLKYLTDPGGNAEFEGCLEINKLKQQIELFTTHSLSAEELRAVMQGVKEVTQNFTNLYKTDEIPHFYQSLILKSAQMDPETKDQWNTQLKTISLSFYHKMYETVAQVYGRAS